MIVNEAIQEASILVVDDQEMTTRLLEKTLQRAGFRLVTGCTDPRRVAALVQSIRPDLIVLDLRMPHLDGFAILQQLERERSGTRPMVLVLTAEGSAAAEAHALAAGADRFMTKPFDRYQLLPCIEEMLMLRLQRG
jgi:putative two-component system response regulator